MNYDMLPMRDTAVLLFAKLHAFERDLSNMREELEDLRERCAEYELSGRTDSPVDMGDNVTEDNRTPTV